MNHRAEAKHLSPVKLLEDWRAFMLGWKIVSRGNLDSMRDWGHARDYVEMQWLMLQQQQPRGFRNCYWPAGVCASLH